MARKVVGSSELFDTLDNIQGNGEFATICYLMGVTINDEYSERRKNPLTNRMKTMPNFERIAAELNTVGLSGFIMLAKYQLHWSSKEHMDKLYGKYKDSANAIRREVGIPEIGNSNKVSHKTIGYGGGVVVGNTPNTTGRTYSMQNGATAKKTYQYYGIDSNGHVIREFSKDEITKYLKFQVREVDGLSHLKKLTQDQKILDDYTARIKALNFSYKKFEADHILYAVGTSQEGKFYFINDNLIDNVKDVTVIPGELRQIAREKCKADYGIMSENIKKYNNLLKENIKMKNKIKLTESQLHEVIKESVIRTLKEGHWDSNVYNEFEEIREMIGDDTLISEMYNWMNSDEIEGFIENIKRQYDL